MDGREGPDGRAISLPNKAANSADANAKPAAGLSLKDAGTVAAEERLDEADQ